MLNQALKFDVIVDNGPKIINSLYYVLGKRLATNIINQTIGKVFCAGENIESVEAKIREQPSININKFKRHEFHSRFLLWSHGWIRRSNKIFWWKLLNI